MAMLTRGLASTANARRAVLWRKISRVLESGVERRCAKTRLPLHAAIGLSVSDMRSNGFLKSSHFYFRAGSLRWTARRCMGGSKSSCYGGEPGGKRMG